MRDEARDREFKRKLYQRFPPRGVDQDEIDKTYGLISTQEYDRRLQQSAEARAFHDLLTEWMKGNRIHLTPEQIEAIGRAAASIYGNALDETRKAHQELLERGATRITF